MCIRKVVILIAFERRVCLSISCYYMRFLCVCLSLSFCTCVCLFLRLSFHLKCCARVRLYYNRVPNSGETAENVLVKNDDNSLILCLSFAVVFASVAIVSFTYYSNSLAYHQTRAGNTFLTLQTSHFRWFPQSPRSKGSPPCSR